MSRPTQQDVARLAGVSRATVSYVINDLSGGNIQISEETRRRVIAAIEQLGYTPNLLARSLRHGKTRTIGLVVPNNANPFYGEVSRGVEKVGYEEEYSVILCNSDRDIEKEFRYSDLLFEKQVDGILFVGAWAGDQTEHLRKLKKRSMPFVVVDRNVQDLNVDVILADNLDGGRKATRHLLELGHRSIGCIAGIPEATPNADRLVGFLAEMNASGLVPAPELVVKADFTYEGGYRAARQMLESSTPPTAIFACNDLMAIGAIRAALDLSIPVPEKLSIVGFDNIPGSSYSNPPITTLSQPMHLMGVLAMKMLLERMEDLGGRCRTEILQTELIVRQSTDRPPQ